MSVKTLSVAVGFGVVLASSAAWAQPRGGGAYAISGDAFAQKGQLVFSADRLFGFYGFRNSLTTPATANQQEITRTDSGALFNFFWGRADTGGNFPAIGAIPRLSVDYFITPNLTLGGSLGLLFSSGSQEVKTGGTANSQDLPKGTTFIFAPRVGYAYMFNDTFGIWPRAGFTYLNGKSEAKQGNQPVTDTTNFNAFDLNIEAMFVISPVSHFAFVAGPLLDIGLTGGASFESKNDQTGTSQKGPDQNLTLTSYGLTAGLLGYFNL